MPPLPDPRSLTSAARTQALAAVLAAGLLRLRRAVIATIPSGHLPSQEFLGDSSPNQLAEPPDTSVTVHAG